MATLSKPWNAMLPAATSQTKSSSSGWQDRIKRYFGGHLYGVDPVTTGYHYAFLSPPIRVLNEIGATQTGPLWLGAVCRAVNIPNIVVNHIEIEGLNNLKWAVPGTVEFDSQIVTLRFLETKGIPVYRLISSWVFVFRNMIYGVSMSEGHVQTDYKGHLCYALVRPDGKTVEFASVFTGVYPANVPSSVFNSELMTHDKIELEVEFHFDQMFIGDEVINLASDLVKSAFESSVGFIQQLYEQELKSASGG